MKWERTVYGLQSGSYNISKASATISGLLDGASFTLKKGGGFVGVFASEAGCKRVAACISRELNKAPTVPAERETP